VQEGKVPENAGKIRDYQDLIVWQKSRGLVKRVYEATRCFPREEAFGLAQQVQKAAVSVPSNIAEGYGRGSRKDYIRFLQTARGSLYEVQTQLLLAQDLGYLKPPQVASLWQDADDCSRVMQGLLRSLKERGRDAAEKGRGVPPG
jgi:four helix bundle protein